MTSPRRDAQLWPIAGHFWPQEHSSKGRQRGLAGGGIDGPVDVLERGRHRLAALPGDRVQAVARQMNVKFRALRHLPFQIGTHMSMVAVKWLRPPFRDTFFPSLFDRHSTSSS
jgi:hypothetical protein